MWSYRIPVCYARQIFAQIERGDTLSSQAKTENYGLCQYGDNDIPDWRTDYTGDMAVIDEQLKARADGENLINKEVTTLKQELEETKKSVSDGKSKVASAITEKGVSTEATDTFDVMVENIGKIQTGISLTQVIGTTTTTSNCADIKTIATHEAYTE